MTRSAASVPPFISLALSLMRGLSASRMAQIMRVAHWISYRQWNSSRTYFCT